jgi:hypothetical protein
MEAGTMIFNFDPEYGECLAIFTDDATCNGGLDSHSFYHWYQIVMNEDLPEDHDNSDTTQPEGLAILVQGG